MSPRRNSSTNAIIGLGARIKAAREAMGWTQAELGKAVGVSKSAVSQWEKGSVQNLKLSNLFRAAEVLQQDARMLVFGAGVEDGAPPYAAASQRLALFEAYGRLPRNVQATLKDLIEQLAENKGR